MRPLPRSSAGSSPSDHGAEAGEASKVGAHLVGRHGEVGECEFTMFGRQWHLLPEVFAPAHTDSTQLFTRWLPFPVGGTFLEMGCGAGVTAVTAALEGCARVTAADINPQAVRNTRLNAARHGVADRVEAVRSDLFDALDPGARFDVVFWNSNVVHAPADFAYTRGLEHAVFDRDYAAHRRYVRDGLARLSGSGRLFLGFNSLGDTARLDAAVAQAGARITEHATLTNRASDVPVAFRLMEITR
ncbi:hypothetical protein GCM10018781_76520 [Kitasatospora indigofera]|uniref:Methyltransferase small domain-containing protein n=1 Tax=Kitasatospora indigofera TaxID=67307 RepID=A0A919D8P8_9ACTN|nr:methyltransferase [Kitasatospora indigofera]GHE25283.1 hypothetical protein GCM10018781_76520 [Kitasatospora indigofera]